jgi:hypothetical protein
MFVDGLFAGKKILVTGGGTGLGKAMAERFLELGAEIAICGRRKGVCDATAEALMKAQGGRVSSYGVDIRDAAAVEAMVDEIFREGPLTGLVNNAAGNFISRTEDLSPRGFDAIANIVMHGTFYVTQAVGKRWIAAEQKGSVVSIAVTWVRNGGPFVVPSAMSKAPHARRRARRVRRAQSDGARRPDGGIAESRDLPHVRRLRVAERRDDRDGRRRGDGDRRKFLRTTPLGRLRMEGGTRRDSGVERARQGRARLRSLAIPPKRLHSHGRSRLRRRLWARYWLLGPPG